MEDISSLKQLFPQELLQSPTSDRLKYYEDCFISHPVMNDAKEQIMRIVRNPGDSLIVLVYGPTGAGKTTLWKIAEREIIRDFLSILAGKPGRILTAGFETALQQSGRFDSKDHLKRYLYALNEPEELINDKINYGVRVVERNDKGEIFFLPRILETDLGWAVEKALIHRFPVMFFMDEAHHMLLSFTSGKKISEMPEAVKSLANRTRVPHTLLGNYDLLTLHDVGDQLSRRSVHIHLRRYDKNFENDWINFQGLVLSFLLYMPLGDIPDLLAFCEFIYMRSLGCPGILKDWFNKALADVYREGSSTLTIKHLENRALSVAQCRNILEKIKIGENKYKEANNADILMKELGLDVPVEAAEPGKDTPSNKSEQSNQTSNKNKNGGKRIGQPNPERYPAGVEDA